MGAAFPEEQPRPQLDRMVAEAIKQLMDSKLFGTDPQPWGQGWPCPGPVRSRAKQSSPRSLSSFSSGSLQEWEGLLLGKLRPKPVLGGLCPIGSMLSTGASPGQMALAQAGVLWVVGRA